VGAGLPGLVFASGGLLALVAQEAEGRCCNHSLISWANIECTDDADNSEPR